MGPPTAPEFLLTAFALCVTPGIGVAYTLSTTLGGGFRAGGRATFGRIIAILLHLAVAIAGLAAILHTSAVLFQIVKFAGVAYLLWMAWAVLHSSGSRAIEAAAQTPAARTSAARIICRGILLNILNPKLPLFFNALLPQFLPATNTALGPMIELGLGVTTMTALTFLLSAAIAASGRRAIPGSPPVWSGCAAPSPPPSRPSAQNWRWSAPDAPG